MIIVTTPTGNVGREVTRLLVERTPNLPFRVAAHNPAKIQAQYGADVPCALFDFSDTTTWVAVLEGITILFLVCPQPDPRTIKAQILPFIDAAIQAGCQHIIYMSVPGANRYKIIPHSRIERHIQAAGTPYTIVRPSYFMQNFYRKDPTHGIDIALNRQVYIPAGTGKISLIDARDIGEAIVTIATHPEAHKNSDYNISGPQMQNFYEIAEDFSKGLEQPITYPKPSIFQFWKRLLARHVPISLLLLMTVEYTVTRLHKTETKTEILPTLIGRPATPLLQFVKDNRERWLKQEWV